jgi:hypothetical protein
MDLNIQIPDNTASIFEYLQKGLFISSNSTSEEVRDMYNEIDENYESLYQYFLQINYTLERGNEYFFFSRIEPKATLEQKIMRAYYWIDVLDFFKTYDETFGPGFRFQPEQILVETNINMLLQNKLDGMRKHFSDKDIRKEVLENMIRQLTKDSFLEQENEKTNAYKVMSAWHYLERLIESINIYDETEDEETLTNVYTITFEEKEKAAFYQIPNADFENWGETALAETWNSFESATGKYASKASPTATI